MALSPLALLFQKSDIHFGFHIAKKRTFLESFEAKKDGPLTAAQIYIANGRGWKVGDVSSEDLRRTKHSLERMGMYACVHAKLLYNIAGYAKPDDPSRMNKWRNTKDGLTSELDVTAGFGKGVVVHMGTCRDYDLGLRNITETLEYVLTTETSQTRELAKELQTPDLITKRKVILENSAGEGTKYGSNLEEIGTIISNVREDLQGQIKVCIDTAHIFGAGEYDFGDIDDFDRFVGDFDRHIGLDRLEVFHLNDSRVKFSSKKDRHENLALGYIFSDERSDKYGRNGLEGLHHLINFAKDRGITLIGEPPYLGADRQVGPHGWWDLGIVKGLCDLEKVNVCD